MAHAAKNHKTNSTEELHAQLLTLKSDVSDLAQTMRAIGVERKDDVKAAASHHVDAMQQKGKDTLESLQKSAVSAGAQAEQSVRDHPAAAIGIAAGLGFLVGLVASRK